MLKQLRKLVCVANRRLPRLELDKFTCGCVSGIERKRGLVVIKPSDVPSKEVLPDDLMVIDLTGKIVEGSGKLPQETLTHLHLYDAFPHIESIAHTHSIWATICAQAGLSIPAFGTTHLEFFKGDIPCTRTLTDEEINSGFEAAVGSVIAETFADSDYMAIPGVLVKNHIPFTWGESPLLAVHNATMLETIAKMAYRTVTVSMLAGKEATLVPKALVEGWGKW